MGEEGIYTLRTNDLPTAIYLIRRRKLGAVPGWHYGVAVLDGRNRPVIYEYSRDWGFRGVSLTDFLEGNQYDVRFRLYDRREIRLACRRLHRVACNIDELDYDLVDLNCEHVARYIVTGHGRSLQVPQALRLMPRI